MEWQAVQVIIEDHGTDMAFEGLTNKIDEHTGDIRQKHHLADAPANACFCFLRYLDCSNTIPSL